MYNFGTFFGVKVMSSAPRDGALISCDVSFVCVCVCVCYSYVRLLPFCKTSLGFFWLCPFCKNPMFTTLLVWAHFAKIYVNVSLVEPIVEKLMLTSFGCVDHFAKPFFDVLRLSSFCKNLCWRSSSNWAHFAKNLCWSSSTKPILQTPMSTFVVVVVVVRLLNQLITWYKAIAHE